MNTATRYNAVPGNIPTAGMTLTRHPMPANTPAARLVETRAAACRKADRPAK